MTNKEAKEKLYMEWQKFLEDNIDYAGISEAYKMAFNALDQESCRDIKEIAEIMKSDADAEIKCKMISNILTAKPHYFEKQEPCEDDYQTDMDEAWEQAKQEEYEKAYDDYLALVNAEQEPKSPCDLCRFDYMDGYCGECPAMSKGEWE